MTIKTIYEPLLRQVTKLVTVFDHQLQAEADEMVKTMHAHRGIGLAANQVGLDKQLLVLQFTPDKEDKISAIPLLQLCNPTITKFSNETTEMNEGCLSIPGLELPVVRSESVVVQAKNLKGKPIKIKAKGLLARILQHEIDHLNGVLFTDRATRFHDQRDLAACTGVKIVFFGSDDFSAPILQALSDNGLNVVAVITETAKPAGRGHQLTQPVIAELAETLNLATFQPESKAGIIEILRQIQPGLIVLASYGKILPTEALTIPTFGALNLHPSLLPKYRGATPIQSALLNGERETGVTLMTMVPAVDAGGIIAQDSVTIGSDDDQPSLRQKLALAGAKLLINQLPDYLFGQAKIKDQDPAVASVTKKTDQRNGRD